MAESDETALRFVPGYGKRAEGQTGMLTGLWGWSILCVGSASAQDKGLCLNPGLSRSEAGSEFHPKGTRMPIDERKSPDRVSVESV